MAEVERDPQSGYLTTGHEWNGIKELNTPVPRIVFVALAITALFSLGYWILMPAFPTLGSYTKGLLGTSDRAEVDAAVKRAAADRSSWSRQVLERSYADIQRDPALMARVRETGRTLFGDNCAVCHGLNGRGGPGFPNLTTQSWLWGGSPEAIARTLQVGINSTHPDTRVSQMPAFGRDGLLKGEEMADVVSYVLSLSNRAPPTPAAKLQDGRKVFEAHCAACHGPEGKGNQEVGAPSLVDHYFMHGKDAGAFHANVWGGLLGRMPGWEGRLSPLDLKILTLYVIALRERP